jgi:hypothetical protein
MAAAHDRHRRVAMRVVKRILAGFTLVLAAVMLLLSLAAAAGVWVVKEPVAARASRTFGRVDAALDIADRGLGQVKASLARAEERLATVRHEQTNLAREPRANNTARRMMARTVARQVTPELGDAYEKLHTVAEAAVVVNSVLEDVGNLSFLSASGLNSDRLTEINSRLAEVGPAAWELSRLLGEPEPDADADAQLSRIEQLLVAVRGLVAEYEPQLARVRQQTEELRSRTFRWITPTAVLVSLVCCWVALSQVSLLVHAWSWWKGADRSLGGG